MSATACVRCGNPLRPGGAFVFRTRAGDVSKCTTCALVHGRMIRRSLLTALVVGTALVLLNQGNVILSGSWQPGLYWKIPLTYCVPFIVATWGALANGRR